MTPITLIDINKLRALTGAGMMACKKSLVEANGDFNIAIQNLRKSGEKVEANCLYQESINGVAIAVVNNDNTEGVAITLNCENENTSKSQDFINLAKNIANNAFKFDTKEDLLNFSKKSIESLNTCEKIEIGYFEKLKGAYIGSYTHTGNKIAVLIKLSAKVDSSEEVAKNIAMQCASMNPLALNEDLIDSEILNREVEIIRHILRQEGKPEAILERITKGKLAKFFKENTLLNQDYIKDNKIDVKTYVKSVNRDLTITGFKRINIQ